MTQSYAQILAKEYSLRPEQVQAVIDLLDAGNTIPFIARYRKEATGSLDDQVLRQLAERLEYLRNLDKRREEIVKALTDQGALKDALVKQIESAATLAELEDIKRAPNRFLPDPKFEPTVTFPRKRASAAPSEVPRTSLDEVSPDAIRKTMDEVERDLGRCERDTLYREVAKRYGYKTLSPKARERLDSVARR